MGSVGSMTEKVNKLSDHEIGERLRIAREAAKMTQAAAADAIGVARTTIVAIEQGQRRVRTDELQKLSIAYKTSSNAILRQEAVHLDMIPRFRKMADTADIAVEDAILLLNHLVSADVELENVLGVHRLRNYPPERPLLPGDVKTQAEEDAQELRIWLGLGAGPVLDLVSILDLQLGIRVYIRRLNGKISGLFSFDESVGGCMLLNANHPAERMTQTCVHELAHFLSTRRQPKVLMEDENSTSREERYANVFSRAFLTPMRAVRQTFAQVTAGQSHLTRRHVILMANTFGVSREAMVRRLEELSLARVGTWDWFQNNGGITNEQVQQVLGGSGMQTAHFPGGQALVPPRLSLLAREVWKRGFYSEDQLRNLLKLDQLQVRELLDGVDEEEREASDLFKLN
jgi:Zn-dependent peptidase ImmA (M78 family)/DNA-binding XRE family transcriptional regulator